MFNGIAEGHWAIYGLAIALGLVVGIWQRNRRKPTWVGIVLGAILVGLIFLLSLFAESPKEKMAKTIQNMAAAASKGNFSQFQEGLSPHFQHHSLGSGQSLVNYLKQWRVKISQTRVVVWDFSLLKDGQENQLDFMLKAEAQSERPYLVRVRANMEKKGDVWVMKGFKLFNPINEREEISLP